ncbi:ribokinase [Motilibacter peucedani]|uniref:Ribokinase n=1 Tax=Motilibacter peucedani TaxID=598650 RepID=A0A420XP72_9ACTN|nr:ribokinase [Motilibacter peucedani]
MAGPGVVVVVGSVNADLVVALERIPRAGETLTASGLERRQGGKGGNQAAAAARLGGDVRFVGRVGDDAEGAAARAALEDDGVDCAALLPTAGEPTGTALVLLEGDGENAIAVVPGANARLSPDDVAGALAPLPGEHVVVLACLEVPVETVHAAARAARQRGWGFVLNPAPAQPLPAELLALVDVLTPNEHELGLLSPGGAPALLEAGVGAVVVTRGAAGADVVTAQGQEHHDAYAVAGGPVDTTGAGDAFSGTLAWALAAQRPLGDAVEQACAAGALATRAVGARAALATAAEVESVLRR